MSFVEQIAGPIILVLGFVLVTASVILRRRRRTADSSVALPQPIAEVIPRAGTSNPTPDVVRQWEVQLHDLGRELQARLDNKIAIIEYLIQTASSEAERLERAVAEARKHGVS